METIGDDDEKFFLKSQDCVYIEHHRRYRKSKEPKSLSTVIAYFLRY